MGVKKRPPMALGCLSVGKHAPENTRVALEGPLGLLMSTSPVLRISRRISDIMYSKYKAERAGCLNTPALRSLYSMLAPTSAVMAFPRKAHNLRARILSTAPGVTVSHTVGHPMKQLMDFSFTYAESISERQNGTHRSAR
jgi:hypothetical protein